jgi:adenosylmethionine-8-amino-7-oxononanoate aminotransferase
MVLGKGLAGGYTPLSAIVAPRRLIDVIAMGSGAFLHAQTFSHHATLCAAGTATITYLRKNNLIERCARMGAVLQTRLQELRSLQCVGDVRGRGLLAGIEFVEDKDTRRPFPRAAGFAEAFAANALDLGLVIWPNAGQLSDGTGDLAMLAPPFVIDEEQIGQVVTIMREACEQTVAQCMREQSRTVIEG